MGNNENIVDHEELETCAVCGKKKEDMRHVLVECFYRVSEIVPEMEEVSLYSQIETDKNMLGDAIVIEKAKKSYLTTDEEKQAKEEKDNVHHIKRVHEDMELTEPMLLRKFTVYNIRCCKKCRSIFLTLLKSWKNGNFRTDRYGRLAITGITLEREAPDLSEEEYDL